MPTRPRPSASSPSHRAARSAAPRLASSRPRVFLTLLALAALVGTAGAAPALAQTYIDSDKTIAVDASRGADQLVDYAALVELGPWDDRNYTLTAADLALLPDNETEEQQPLPAFFRVLLRRHLGDLADNPDTRYPLSALNVFRQNFGGYLIGERYYKRAELRDGRYFVVLDQATSTSVAETGVDEVVEGEVRVTSPEGAAESAIAINPVDRTRLIAGSNGPRGGQRMHWSADGGATWTQVDLPLGGTCCDPTVEWSTDGQFAYTATLGCFIIFCDLWFYRSDDGGQTWTGLENETPGDPRREIADGADREFMHVDQAPTSAFKDNIYITYHNSNIMRLARSSDFGNTWEVEVFSSASEERGIAGDVATDRQGRVYFVWPAFNSQTVRLLRSDDGGATFGPSTVVSSTKSSFTYPIPVMESRAASNYVSADVDLSEGSFSNSVYLAWGDTVELESSDPQANNSRVVVAYSRDRGDTWSFSTPHETSDAESVDRFQPFLVVGDDGVVHVTWYDTRRAPDRQAADLFYAYSTDGGVSWSTPQRVTSELSPNIADSFEFGDYNGLDMVMDDLVAIFTDNRSEDGSSGDSVDVYAAGIEPGRLTGGGGAPGRIPGARDVPGGPLLVSKAAGELTLDWEPVCGEGNDYAVYAGNLATPESKAPLTCSTGSSTSYTLTPAAGSRFYLVTAHDGTAEGSYGQTSALAERAPADAACFPQSIGPCP